MGCLTYRFKEIACDYFIDAIEKVAMNYVSTTPKCVKMAADIKAGVIVGGRRDGAGRSKKSDKVNGDTQVGNCDQLEYQKTKPKLTIAVSRNTMSKNTKLSDSEQARLDVPTR